MGVYGLPKPLISGGAGGSFDPSGGVEGAGECQNKGGKYAEFVEQTGEFRGAEALFYGGCDSQDAPDDSYETDEQERLSANLIFADDSGDGAEKLGEDKDQEYLVQNFERRLEWSNLQDVQQAGGRVVEDHPYGYEQEKGRPIVDDPLDGLYNPNKLGFLSRSLVHPLNLSARSGAFL